MLPEREGRAELRKGREVKKKGEGRRERRSGGTVRTLILQTYHWWHIDQQLLSNHLSCIKTPLCLLMLEK